MHSIGSGLRHRLYNIVYRVYSALRKNTGSYISCKSQKNNINKQLDSQVHNNKPIGFIVLVIKVAAPVVAGFRKVGNPVGGDDVLYSVIVLITSSVGRSSDFSFCSAKS